MEDNHVPCRFDGLQRWETLVLESSLDLAVVIRRLGSFLEVRWLVAVEGLLKLRNTVDEDLFRCGGDLEGMTIPDDNIYPY